jgi:ATP-binding cassette subfamily C (CFTR/MRP) protein 10
VVGKVGSGKSSLLNAILAEMRRVGGQICIQNLEEGFALVSQEAWIQQCTIRDNILFGRQYDHRRYERVLEAAALSQDLMVSLLISHPFFLCQDHMLLNNVNF